MHAAAQNRRTSVIGTLIRLGSQALILPDNTNRTPAQLLTGITDADISQVPALSLAQYYDATAGTLAFTTVQLTNESAAKLPLLGWQSCSALDFVGNPQLTEIPISLAVMNPDRTLKITFDPRCKWSRVAEARIIAKGDPREIIQHAQLKANGSENASSSSSSKEGEMDFDVNSIIKKLLEVRGSRAGKNANLSESEIQGLCMKSREIFLSQPMLLELNGPVKVCGDIHGQYFDLLRLFEYGGFPPDANYLFLGNYVDYGKQSVETICLLLAYKIKYPENFFLLRGNHECASINRTHGFFDECKRRYNIKLWKSFTDCFNCMPLAAIVDKKIFCMHGGLSPDLKSMEQFRRIVRPTDVPDNGLMCDLLWSDPDKDIQGWGENDDRGVSYTFGSDIVAGFLQRQDLDLICRGHQVVEDGYEFFAQRQLVTVFSAPNFRGEYDNAGAIMSVDEDLMVTFQILKPSE